MVALDLGQCDAGRCRARGQGRGRRVNHAGRQGLGPDETVLGKDRVGIIARVSAVLADNGVNILDISQTILQDYFTMIMLAGQG